MTEEFLTNNYVNASFIDVSLLINNIIQNILLLLNIIGISRKFN